MMNPSVDILTIFVDINISSHLPRKIIMSC